MQHWGAHQPTQPHGTYDFDSSDVLAGRLKQCPERADADAFPEATDDTAGHNNVLHTSRASQTVACHTTHKTTMERYHEDNKVRQVQRSGTNKKRKRGGCCLCHSARQHGVARRSCVSTTTHLTWKSEGHKCPNSSKWYDSGKKSEDGAAGMRPYVSWIL